MKKASALLLVFGCLLPYAYGQENYTFLLHKPYEQRCRLIDSLFSPATMLYDTLALARKLEHVSTLAQRENDEELYLEIQYRKLRFTRSIQHNNSIEAEIKELVQQAEHKNQQQLLVKATDLLAWYYHLNNNIGASIEQYLNTQYLMKGLPVTQFPDKRDYLYNDLASIYYGLEDYDNAKALLLEANSLPFSADPAFIKARGVVNVNNTLGLIYRTTAQYDSAIFFFKEAYATALQAKDSAWLGIADGNIGITYFLQKRYAEATPLLENDVRLSLLWKEYGNAANSLLKLAEINLIQNEKEAMHRQMVQIRQLIAPQTTDFIPHLNSYYLLMTRLYSAEANPAAAYRYADSSLLLTDTLFQMKSAVQLVRAQQKTNIAHHRLEVGELEHQQKIQALVRNGLLGALVLLTIISLLLVSRQRLLKKQKLFAEIRRLHIQQELGDARKQLHSFTTNIREKNEWIERLTLEMVNLKNNLDNEVIDYRKDTLNQLRQQTILTEEEWEVFKTSFEKVYPAWLDGIRKKLPGLSAADLRFMALSKLKLTTREMANLLGISPGSVRMSRHRLRKKYNLTEEESLELLAEEA